MPKKFYGIAICLAGLAAHGQDVPAPPVEEAQLVDAPAPAPGSDEVRAKPGEDVIAAPAAEPGLQEVTDEELETAIEKAQEPTTAEQDAPPLLPPLDVPDNAVILPLEEAQARAVSENPSLQAALMRVEQARERVVQARSLYFPQVSASYSATHTHLPNSSIEEARDAARDATYGTLAQSLSQFFQQGFANLDGFSLYRNVAGVGQSIIARDSIDENIETYDAAINASYILFDGFARRFSVAIARYGAQETEAARLEAQRLLLDAVATAFYGIQLARENIAIARADEQFNERLLQEAQARRRVGTGSLSDVLNFEVLIRAARAAVLEGERQYELARIGLATLMGIPEAALASEVRLPELVAETADEMASPEEEPLLTYASESRPDVIRARYTLERAGAAIGLQRSNYYPQVAAFGSKSASRGDDGRFDENDFGTTVGVSVDVDIFTGGRNRSLVREAKHAQREAEYLLEEAELNARADVRESLVDLHIAQEQLILQRATAEYVERNRDLVEREYRVGQGALARLNQAQRDLIEAQARLALARVSLRQAWQSLRGATAQTLAPFADLEQ